MKTTSLDQGATNTGQAEQTAHAILPTELWFPVFALCEAAARLPATFGAASSELFKVGALPHRTWAHRTIFLVGQRPANKNKLESPLRRFLNTQLSLAASANQNGQGRSRAIGCLVTGDLIDWLFCASGPFGHKRHLERLGWMEELRFVCARVPDQVGNDCQAQGDTVCAFPNWRLIPDSLLLVDFAIQTLQLDLLERTLLRLRTALPRTLATSTAPFSLWCHQMLTCNDRLSQRALLATAEAKGQNPSMTYPTFLCFLALLEWSLPALQIVANAFADTLDVGAAASLIASSKHMFECMLMSLPHMMTTTDDSCCVLDVITWLKHQSAPINTARFPFIASHVKASYPLFTNVFMAYDLVNLHIFAGNHHQREALGSAVVDWVERGYSDLLGVALEQGIVGQRDLGRVLRRAASCGDTALADLVLDLVSVDDEALCQMVLIALEPHHVQERPLSFYCFLLNILVTRGSGPAVPNQLLMEHGQNWPRSQLSIMFYDCAASGNLLFEWDYPQHLLQHLTWAKDVFIYRDPDWFAFMGALIDQCSCTDGFDWQTLQVDQVALACAIRLIALMQEFSPCQHGRSDESKVADNVVSIVRTLVNVTVGKINKHGSPPSPWSPLLTLIGPSYELKLATLVSTLTKFRRPNPPRPNVIACPSTAFNLYLDSMLVLDRALTVSHIHCEPWAIFAWSKLDAGELARRLRWISVNCAIGLARAAAEVMNEDMLACVVGNLPDAARDSDKFVRGLGAVMRDWPDRGALIVRALDRSGWNVWREKITRQADVPLADGEGQVVVVESGDSSFDELDVDAFD